MNSLSPPPLTIGEVADAKPAMHHALNYHWAGDILKDAIDTDIPWDAHSVRLLGKKMAKWIESLEQENALLRAGIRVGRERFRRPPARPPKGRAGNVPFVEGYCSRVPAGPIVYFLHGVGTNLVKIGWTEVSGPRIADLAVGSPVPLRLLSWQRVLGRSCEQMLHAQFDEYREYGEWFRLEGRLLEYIEQTDVARRRRSSPE